MCCFVKRFKIELHLSERSVILFYIEWTAHADTLIVLV